MKVGKALAAPLLEAATFVPEAISQQSLYHSPLPASKGNLKPNTKLNPGSKNLFQHGSVSLCEFHPNHGKL